MPGTVPSPGVNEPGNRNSEPAALQALQRNIFRYESTIFTFMHIYRVLNVIFCGIQGVYHKTEENFKW
jgi:hypothetical protein